jgi:hypothetical protein
MFAPFSSFLSCRADCSLEYKLFIFQGSQGEETFSLVAATTIHRERRRREAEAGKASKQASMIKDLKKNFISKRLMLYIFHMKNICLDILGN